MKRRSFAKITLITMMVILAIPAIAQSFAAGGQWSGSIQCQLDVQVQGYARHEMQTWTLTGEPSSTAGGTGMPVYAASWNYTGQGQLQRMDGSRATMAQWAINVVPGDAPLSIFVRDGVLIVKRASGQQRRYNGLNGQRQIAVNGVPQQPTPMTSYALWEWNLPWIEAGPSSNVSGTLTVQTEGIGADIQQPGPPPFANCKYQFTKTSPNIMAVTQNCPQAASIAQTFDGMKANLAREFDALIQQTQNPARRATLSAQKQRMLNELDNLKQQNLSASAQACQSTPGTNTAQNSGNSGTQGTNTAQNSPGTGSSTTNSGQSGTGGQNQNSGQRSAAPQLLNITPSSVEQGSPSVQVALVAQATNWQMNVTKVDFGPGITVTGPFVTKPNEAYALVSVAPDAAPGPRSVKVTTNNEAVSLPTTFTVNAKSSGNQNIGFTSPVNAMGGGGQQVVFEGGQPVFTAAPPTSNSVPAPTAEVTGVNVTRNAAPEGTQTPTASNPVSTPTGPSKNAFKDKNPTKQLTAVSTPASPPSSSQPGNQPQASGKYLVTMTGLWCVQPTQDDPLSFDGHGDEIYAAAYIRKYDRTSSQIQMYTARQTWVYGDSNKSDRIQAGSQTAQGGIRGYDSIPSNATADRRFPPQDSNHQFPYKLWGGTLTDGADALLISPSIWESDGKTSLFLQWNQKQSALNSSIYLNTKVLDQITSNRFGSLNLGTTVSTTGTVTSAANTFSDVSLVLLGIPPLAMLTNGGDRPIGLVESDPNQNALTNTAVVLTREIIETALSGSVPAPYTYGPYLTIPFQKPGIMAIPFTDSTSTPGAMYVMTVQVERCDGSLLQYCAD